MKVLEIDENVEKMLIAVFDAALKANGMHIIRLVNELSSKIKEKAPDSVEEK